MAKAFSPAGARGPGRWASFSLVEMLVVIAVIAILCALTLSAASAVMNAAARNRAKTEIQAMNTALDDYKIDNGAYPAGYSGSGTALTTNTGSYPLNPTFTANANYQNSSTLLYLALSGRTNFTDVLTSAQAASLKSYINFKVNQVGNPTGSPSATFVQDPWRYAYGYSTGDGAGNLPYAGSGFFDLWSTGGSVSDNTKWIDTWGS